MLLWPCDRGWAFIIRQIFIFALPLNQKYICNMRKGNSQAGNSSKATQKRQTVKLHSGASDHKLAPVNSSVCVWGRAPVHTLHPPLISQFHFQNNPHPASLLGHVWEDDRREGRRKWVAAVTSETDGDKCHHHVQPFPTPPQTNGSPTCSQAQHSSICVQNVATPVPLIAGGEK